MAKYLLNAETGTYAVSTSRATLRLKTGFALNHLQVAADSARQAYKVEQTNRDTEFGPWFDGMMRLVPVCVVMAGAALEASANELLQDFLDGLPNFPITGSRKRLLEDLKDDRSGNATIRCRRLALLMDKDADTGAEGWGNAALLIKFRYEFMHFRPSWDSDDIHDGKLVERLRIKVPVVKAFKGKLLFPHGFMTYGCAKWAVQTVLTFSAEFTEVLGVNDRFTLPGLDFNLP
jgi:hypothetical protein